MTAHADYHADRTRISTSALKLFAESPRLFRLWETGSLDRKPTDSMRAGTRLHETTLGQPLTYAVIPEDAPKRPTKAQREAKKPSDETVQAIAFWDAFDAQTAHLEGGAISSDENLETHVQSLAAMHAFMPILSAPNRRVEQRIDFDINGVPCKAKPDLYVPGSLILDLKTCRDASSRAFSRQAYALGYHIQAAFYRRAVEAATGERLPFVFGAVESKPRSPGVYLCQMHRATDAFLADGDREVDQLLAEIAECRKNDRWPDFRDPQDDDGMAILDVPAWKQDVNFETEETEV